MATACTLPAFVKTRGTQFVVDAHPFFINGFNAYFLMAISVDPSSRSKVTAFLQQAAASGLNVIRTWAFNDGGYQALQTSPGVYDEQVFQALDFVVSEAKRLGIRLILSLVNNFSDYGGKAQYVQWGRNAGLALDSEDAFFSNPTVQGYYKDHIKAVLMRENTITGVIYKDEPAIFAWELMNEPRCLKDPSGDMLQGWIEEMAAYVKYIDSNHLLEIGMEGFYNSWSSSRVSANPNSYCQQLGTDFLRNHQVPGIDFASVHAYPDSWLGSNCTLQQQISFMQTWMDAHIKDCEGTLQMPVLFGEFGMSDKDPGYTTSNRGSLFATIYGNIYESASKGGAAGGALVWQIFPEGMEAWNDGYEIVLSKDTSTASLIIEQSRKVEALNAAVRPSPSPPAPGQCSCLPWTMKLIGS